MLSELLKKENYTVEIVTDFTQEFIESVVNMYYPYSTSNNSLSENYSPQRIRHCFAAQRFEHGFVITRYCNDIVLTFGIDDFCGWGVITRYLRHGGGYFVPVAYGVAIPHILSTMSLQIKGLCSTHNINERKIMDVVQDRYRKSGDSSLLESAASLISKIRTVPYNVVYRNTVQSVCTYDTNMIPPFKPVR